MPVSVGPGLGTLHCLHSRLLPNRSKTTPSLVQVQPTAIRTSATHARIAHSKRTQPEIRVINPQSMSDLIGYLTQRQRQIPKAKRHLHPLTSSAITPRHVSLSLRSIAPRNSLPNLSTAPVFQINKQKASTQKAKRIYAISPPGILTRSAREKHLTRWAPKPTASHARVSP